VVCVLACVRVVRVHPPLLVQTLGAPTIGTAGGHSNQNGMDDGSQMGWRSDRVVDEGAGLSTQKEKKSARGC
jgi:hypothetical protein